MAHPFTIGSTYANNLGSYTVLAIEPPNLRVRYADGNEAMLEIALQARIWARLQADAEPLSEEPTAPRAARGRQAGRPRSPSPRFQGLVETDFKDNVTGTTWRRRENLGGLVASRLSALVHRDYLSRAMPRETRFFVYRPHVPTEAQNSGVKVPKFVVQLDPEQVTFGLYIEKSDEPMDEEWYWPSFLRLLGTSRWQREFERAMASHEMYWVVRLEEAMLGLDMVAPEEVVVASFAHGTLFPTFAAFIKYLQALPSDRWCNLYLEAAIPKGEAIALGPRLPSPSPGLSPPWRRCTRNLWTRGAPSRSEATPLGDAIN